MAEGRTPSPDGTTTHLTRAQKAAGYAQELISFADGVEDAGHPELARRSRLVARETLWLVQALADEFRVRLAMRDDRDRVLALFMDRKA